MWCCVFSELKKNKTQTLPKLYVWLKACCGGVYHPYRENKKAELNRRISSKLTPLTDKTQGLSGLMTINPKIVISLYDTERCMYARWGNAVIVHHSKNHIGLSICAAKTNKINNVVCSYAHVGKWMEQMRDMARHLRRHPLKAALQMLQMTQTRNVSGNLSCITQYTIRMYFTHQTPLLSVYQSAFNTYPTS